MGDRRPYKGYRPAWHHVFDPLPEDVLYRPMTAREFRALYAATVHAETTRSVINAATERQLAGWKPLRPFHPIARQALPKLRSIDVA
jgi:hypothetical protein